MATQRYVAINCPRTRGRIADKKRCFSTRRIISTWTQYSLAKWVIKRRTSVLLLSILCVHTIFWQWSVKSAASDKLDASMFDFPWKGARVLAVGDLHGDLHNTVALLYGAGVVDSTGSWIGEDALLIQTGDILDRGPEGIRIVDYLTGLSVEAKEAGGRVIQLLGNHDVMNVCGDFRYAHHDETRAMGGLAGRRMQFKDGRYGKLLRSLFVAVKVNGIIYSHAGIPPRFAGLGLQNITRRLWEELENDCEIYRRLMYNPQRSPGHELAVSGNDGPLWTRMFSLEAPAKICSELDQTLAALNGQKMVIGHTVQETGNIETLCDGRLILIDTGLSRYVANRPKMLEEKGGVFYEWSLDSTPLGNNRSRRPTKGLRRQLIIAKTEKVALSRSAESLSEETENLLRDFKKEEL